MLKTWGGGRCWDDALSFWWTLDCFLPIALHLAKLWEGGEDSGEDRTPESWQSSHSFAWRRDCFFFQPLIHGYFSPFKEVQVNKVGESRKHNRTSTTAFRLSTQPCVLGGSGPRPQRGLHSRQHLSLKLFLFLLLFLPFLSLFSDIFFALISLIKSKNTWEWGERVKRREEKVI